MEFPELPNTYRANFKPGKTSKYNFQYVVFQDLENLLLLKKKVLKHHILQVVFQNILTGPPKYFYATIRARRPILLLLQLFILMRLSRFILQSVMNNLLNNQGF